MALRDLMVSVGFDINDNPLNDLNKSVDNTANNISNKMGQMSESMSSVGKNLTKKLTLPILAVGGAATGLVGKLGFDRLVEADSARAKLKGLGYSVQDVGRISEQVTNAIKGGMTTAAEGTNIAAGALAAGVSEGKKLERYIKLVGDAAVGANRPVDDMAMIFNRVQGAGKLMTMELNSIEQGMPGFSNKMSEHLGVPVDEMRKMVTEGKVSSDDFLDVMEGFAGGMADEYSKSWAGMMQNTKAYVGIIGESLIEGLFVDGKEGLADFIEMLKSDEVQEWARQTGQKISEVAKKIINGVKGMVNWYKELSPTIKNVFGKVMLLGGLFMTVIGPALVMLAPLFGILGSVLTFLISPIGLIIAGVGLLIAGFMLAYNKIEWFRNGVNAVLTFIADRVIAVFDMVKIVVSTGIAIIKGIVAAGMAILKGDWSAAWEAVKGIFVAAWEGIKALFGSIDLFQTGKNIIMGLVRGFGAVKDKVLNKAREIATGIKDTIKGFFKIGSPSKLMQRLAGFVGDGFVIGLDGSVPKIEKSSENMGHAVTSQDYAPSRAVRGTASRGQYNMSPSFVFNISGDISKAEEEELEKVWKRKVETWFVGLQQKMAVREV